MAEADVDGDGYITYDEFKAVYCSRLFVYLVHII